MNAPPALPILLLAAAGFLSSAGARVIDPLLSVIALDFGTTVPAVSIVVAAYTLPYGLCQVLLGPAGSPGSYGATLTTFVTRGNGVVARRSARVSATIPGGQSGADFAYVEDGITVPAGQGDVEIFVSLGHGGAAAPARHRRR